MSHLLPARSPPNLGAIFFILRCSCSCSDLGFLTVSSIDRMVHAASVAADRALIFTRVGSHTKDS